MTTSNSKPTQVLLLPLITFFLFLLNKVNSLDDLSFSFNNKFAPNGKDLLFQGDASVSSTGILRITKVEKDLPTFSSVGRARYSAPVNIWDSATFQEASFSTSFSFVVKQPLGTGGASGLAFFLAPPDSQIGQSGQFLGLFQNQNNDTLNQVVAVEFDTYSYGAWDPSFPHIGINVNGIKSIKTERWDWRNGEEAIVTISYLARTKTLSASLTYPSDQKSYIVSATVDLTQILPEWVKVGFSAATSSKNAEIHDILQWDFVSTFKADKYGAHDTA